MDQAKVKARKVGDSIVMTLPSGVLRSTGISDGDSLVVRPGRNGFISVCKEGDKVAQAKEATMELAILQRRLGVVDSEIALAVSEHNNSMPTLHPGIEDSLIMEGFVKEKNYERSKIQLEIAEKELDIYRMGDEHSND